VKEGASGVAISIRFRVDSPIPHAIRAWQEAQALCAVSSTSAVLWAYVVPFVVLLGALVAASLAGWSDGAAALAAVGGIALYYGALYLLRERLEKKIHFKIHKQ